MLLPHCFDPQACHDLASTLELSSMAQYPISTYWLWINVLGDSYP